MPEETPKKILLVDDEEETLASLTGLLERNHYKVISTAKGIEAIELTRRFKPDLIILDRVLPDIDGLDVASILAEDHSTAQIPILFLTGVSMQGETISQTGKSKRYVIEKPIQAKELLNTISDVLASS